MKFRAVMQDTIPMRFLTNIVMTLSKISKEAVLRLTSNSVHFIISEECGSSVPKVWCDLDVASFFSEYQMEGVDKINNEIYLGFVTGTLAKSLASLRQNARSIKIKLTNRHCPCLTFEIELSSGDLLHSRQLVHDNPVTVIPRKTWPSYDEPRNFRYHVSFTLPELKHLKTTVEHMKNMSPALIIKVNKEKMFILQIKTDMATVSSTFRNISTETMNDSDREDCDSDDDDDKFSYSCRVDIKKFLMFLSAEQINHNGVICKISHKKVVNLLIENEGIIKFQCFIPSLSY